MVKYCIERKEKTQLHQHFWIYSKNCWPNCIFSVLPMHTSVFTHNFIYILFISLYISLSSICLSVCLFACLPVHLSAHLSIFISLDFSCKQGSGQHTFFKKCYIAKTIHFQLLLKTTNLIQLLAVICYGYCSFVAERGWGGGVSDYMVNHCFPHPNAWWNISVLHALRKGNKSCRVWMLWGRVFHQKRPWP